MWRVCSGERNKNSKFFEGMISWILPFKAFLLTLWWFFHFLDYPFYVCNKLLQSLLLGFCIYACPSYLIVIYICLETLSIVTTADTLVIHKKIEEWKQWKVQLYGFSEQNQIKKIKWFFLKQWCYTLIFRLSYLLINEITICHQGLIADYRVFLSL